MKKAEFLQELEERLRVLNDQERQDVLDEYVQHIDMKTAAGMSEEEAVGDFGNLDELITDLLDAYHVNSEYATEVSGRAYKRSAAGESSRIDDVAAGQEAGSNFEHSESTAKDAGRGLGNTAKNMGYGLGSAAKNVGHGLGSVAKNVGHGLGNAAKGVGHGLGSAVKTAGRGAGSAAKASGRGLRYVVAGLRVLLKKGAQAAKRFCLVCWDMTKRAGKAAAHAVHSLWRLFVRFLLWIAAVVRGACSAVKRGVQHIFHGREQEQWIPSAEAFHGREQEQWIPSVEACGQDETGGAQTWQTNGVREARTGTVYTTGRPGSSDASGSKSSPRVSTCRTGRPGNPDASGSSEASAARQTFRQGERAGRQTRQSVRSGQRSLLYRMAAWTGRTLRSLCILCAKAVLLMAVLPVLTFGLVALFIAGTTVVLLVQGYPVVGITVAVFGAVLCLFGISALILSFVFTGRRAKNDAAGMAPAAEQSEKSGESREPSDDNIPAEAQEQAAPPAQPSDVITAEPEGRNQDELS